MVLRNSAIIFSVLLLVSGCSGSSSSTPEESTTVFEVGDSASDAASQTADTDGDGLTDDLETQLGLDPLDSDTDGDGISDGLDQLSHDDTACAIDDDNADAIVTIDDASNIDTDADGVSDDIDAFPFDPAETTDANNDGQGDNAFPVDDTSTSDPVMNDDQQNTDTDGDGLFDEQELALGLDPLNPDTDLDGVADGVDQFPNDATATLDSDADGVSDEIDAFPNDPTETADLNNDGLGDNAVPFDGTVIAGTVTDFDTDAALANATVRLELVNSNLTNSVVQVSTDAIGSYSLLVEESLVPDSFVVVTSLEGYQPAVSIYEFQDDTTISGDVALEPQSSDYVGIEIDPLVHHLGDDDFSGSENSQFQRTSEALTLTRNFNLTESQASSTDIVLRWVAKGVQFDNTVTINGQLISTTPSTNTDGSFTEQEISLNVAGVLTTGANSIVIESIESRTFDDFEFVVVGLVGFN